MCGRYASARKRQELLEEFSVERDRVTESLEPDYNVAPTKPVYAVLTRRVSGARESSAEEAGTEEASTEEASTEEASTEKSGTGQPSAERPGTRQPGMEQPSTGQSGGEAPQGQDTVRELRVVRWGLVPSWAKDVSIGSRMINARAETVSTKPAFRRAFARRRCLLPADGFYEWQAAGDDPHARKQPYYIHRADGDVLAFAGIYELWRNPDVPDGESDAWLWTAAIITTQAPDDLGRIHDRTPMVIEPARWADWLDPQQADEATLHALLAPAVSGALTSYPVSTEVNAVRHNGPGLIEPLNGEPSDASHGAAGRLF